MKTMNDKDIEFYNRDYLDPENRTFVMYYPDPNASGYWRETHGIQIRPSNATYEEFLGKTSKRVITINPVIVRMSCEKSIQEAVLSASVFGITVDFVEVVTQKNDGFFGGEKTIRFIDTHKDDLVSESERTSADRMYIVKNKSKRNKLHFLVVDRYLQDQKIDFLHGDYDSNAVVAGFAMHEDAMKFVESHHA